MICLFVSPGGFIFIPQLCWAWFTFAPHYWLYKGDDSLWNRKLMILSQISWLFLWWSAEGLWILAITYMFVNPEGEVDPEYFNSWKTTSLEISAAISLIQFYALYVTI